LNEWTVQLRSPSRYGRFGWSADASNLTLRNSTVVSRDNAQLRAAVLVEVSPELMLAASFGRDRTDFTGRARRPLLDPGRGHRVGTRLRAPSSRANTRSASSGTDTTRPSRTAPRSPPGGCAPATTCKWVGQLLQRSSGPAALFYDVLTTTVPDRDNPGRRRAPPPGRVRHPGPVDHRHRFRVGTPLLVRDFEASAVYTGARDTLTLAFMRSSQRPVGTATSDVAVLRALDITEYGYRVALSHRLTPLTNLNLVRSARRVVGTGLGEPRVPPARLGHFAVHPGRQADDRLDRDPAQRVRQQRGTAFFRENSLVISIVYRL
jgi:hypothetical protein